MIQKHPKFKPLYSTDKRYILLTGGRAGAKSFHASTFATELTYEAKQRILFTRYTMASAEISIIPEFKDKIDRLEVSHDFKVNATDIVNKKTNCDILFRGIKASSGIQTANLKSISGVSTWIIDEAEELVDEEIFDTIDLSIRTRDVQNTIIIIMNPSNMDHWVYKRWIANNNRIEYFDGYPVPISTHPDVLHIHTTYLDNIKHLDEKLVTRIIKQKEEAPKWYGHKIIGQWNEVADGAIFSSENLKFFKDSELLEGEMILGYIDVADTGKDFLCMVIGKNVNERVYISDVVFSDKNADITIPMCVESVKRNKVGYCRVESNNMGAMFGRSLQKATPECSVMFINNDTNKHTRILMEAPFIYQYFYFKDQSERSATYEAFMNQLFRYTKDGEAEHDDAADAISGLSIFVRRMLAHLYN